MTDLTCSKCRHQNEAGNIARANCGASLARPESEAGAFLTIAALALGLVLLIAFIWSRDHAPAPSTTAPDVPAALYKSPAPAPLG